MSPFPGETVSGRGVCDSGAERGVELHRLERSQTWRDEGAANQIRQRSPAERNAATRGSQ